LIIVTKCDGCNKYDANVVIGGKRYCKPCFDERHLSYDDLDHVEENREDFEALGMKY
jgi:hypothetical protein